MKAYKGFNKDTTCRGFQFEAGKTYEEEKAELCSAGFHACENPLDCFAYYAPGQSVFHEVELEDVSDERRDDSKICGKKITVGAKLDVAGIVKAHFEYVTSRCEKVDGSVAGDKESVAVKDKQACSAGYRGSASAGNCGSASAGNCGSASAGYRGSASAGESGSASAGESGSASAGESGSASAGYRGSASAGYRGSASAGNCGSASAGESGSASAGYRGSASAGNCGSASAGESGSASAGNCGSASAGESGSAVSRGTVSVGENGVGLVRGNNVKIRGGVGALLVIAEEETDSYSIASWKSFIVDGEQIKADTWYVLLDGELVESKEDE